MSTFVAGPSPKTASKVIVAIAKGVAKVVAVSRDRDIPVAKGQVILTHRSALGAVNAYRRGSNQPEGFVAIGDTFPASILQDGRYKSGVVASWAAMQSKEDAQKAARKASREALSIVTRYRKAGLVL